MPVTFDVVVIGGGITAVSAALAAQQRGASTCLIRRAPGSTALISGAWTGPLRTEIRTGLSDAGYPFVAVRAPLAHQRGDLLSCNFAGSTHATATVTEETLVCGVAGLPNFNAHALARLWQREQLLDAQTIELPGTPAGGWAAAALAGFIERSPQTLLQHLQKYRARRVIFPAVLGLERASSVIEQLAADGIVIGEALATTPSIPGWRLWHALERLLSARSIACFTGRAELATATGGRVQSLRYGSETVHARSFVLATGKFAAGGIIANEAFHEPVFDFPIWLEQHGDVFTAPDPLPLSDPVRTAHQPLLETGVHTDQMLRPINRAQEVIYHNVFAAGTIRAGWNVAATGMGHCAEDGWNAGVNAAA